MIRKSEEPLKKVTLNLFAKDIERLQQLYPQKHSTYLRKLLRAHLTRVEQNIAEGGTSLASEITLD